MNTSIVIPCFNEEENIEKLFTSFVDVLKKEDVEVIFVNNGSTDNSKKIFNDLEIKYRKYKDNFKVIDLLENKGYGGGIQEGLKLANGDILGWCHADNQVDIYDILYIVKAFKSFENKNILIKGSRKNRNNFDNFFTTQMSFFVKIITGHKITDINAQPKLFPKEFYSKDKKYSLDFLFDLDFLLDVKKSGYDIKELEVNNLDRLYGVAKGGGSIKGKLKLTIKTLSYLIKYHF